MQLGNQITPDDEWDRKAPEVMYQCMLIKFKTDTKLKDKLLSTGALELVEAMLNNKWGAAATLNSGEETRVDREQQPW